MLLISLTGKPLQYCLSIPKTTIASNRGVEAILDTLEKVYQEQSGSTSYKLFSQLAAMEREDGELIRAYIQRFDNQIENMKEKEFTIPDEVITFQFLKGSRLSETNKQLISVSCDPLEYDTVKEATLRLYSTGTTEKRQPVLIKHEPERTMFQSSQDIRNETRPRPDVTMQYQHQLYQTPAQNVYYNSARNMRPNMSYQQNQPPVRQPQDAHCPTLRPFELEVFTMFILQQL